MSDDTNHEPTFRCAHCREPTERNKSAPFCSERCRLVDLSRWFGGDYAVPAEDAPVDWSDE